MKIVISESQYQRLIETEEEQKILKIPSFEIFNNDWFLLQKFLEKKGNPPYSIGGDLDLRFTSIKSLGDLQSVGGDLDLRYKPIESLGNLQSVGGDLDLHDTRIKSLGNLQSVGGSLDLEGTPIKSLGNLQYVGRFLDLRFTSIKSLGNLQSVVGNLFLYETPISKKYSEEEIRQMVNVGGEIYL